MPISKKSKKSDLKTGHSSQLLNRLFGDISPFSRLLEEKTKELNNNYPDRRIAQIFSKMKTRMIPLMPMALYSATMKDLGKEPDKLVLTATGLCTFPTVTLDDLVEEMPGERKIRAGLVYSGSIATSEGLKVLIKNKKIKVIRALVRSVNQNHYRQKKIIDILWQGKEVTTEKYLEGIRQIVDFTSIGLLTAIADASMPELRERIMEFSDGYGYSIQLIDDMREVEEDRIAGYTSLPLQEGKPFTESFKIAFSKLRKARASLKPEWKNLARIVSNTEQLLREMKNEFG